jgi:ParB family chromosome partitioning protein
MSDRERRLGRGLEALIGAARDKSLDVELLKRSGHRVQRVSVESLEPNPFQPRREFPTEELNQLVESLRNNGLMQPILVRRHGEGHQILAGERRWRAARELGWSQIEAVVVDADDRRMVQWALIENVQRQDLSPMDLAHAFRQMSRDFGMKQEEIATEIGMSRPSVANLLRLLDLPAEIQQAVAKGAITMGAARALLALPDDETRKAVAARIERGELTVRQVEDLSRRPLVGGSAGSRQSTPDPNLKDLAEELQERLATKVSVTGSIRRGRVIIHFHSARQLDELVRRIRQGSVEAGAPSSEADADPGAQDATLTV